MKRSLAILVTCEILAGCGAISGPPDKALKEASREAPSTSNSAGGLPLLDFKRDQESLFRLYSKLDPLPSGVVDCTSATCTVPVKLYNGPSPDDPSQTICLVQVPERINVDLSNKNEVLIVWQLVPTGIQNAGFSYGFETTYGILLLSGAQGMHKLKRGDDGAHPNSDQYFNGTAHKHKPTQTASYFPIVLQTLTNPPPNQPNPAAMCAATDPVIVNSD